MSDLKPCPFCGGEAKDVVKRKRRIFEAFVQCRKCNAKSGVMLTEPFEKWNRAMEEAIEAWNRRASECLGIHRT